MKNSFSEKIQNLVLRNYAIRKIRLFFKYTVGPFLAKFFLITITSIIFILLALKIFKPVYLDKIYNNLSYHFYHILSLDNQIFDGINISGNQRVTKDEILTVIDEAQKKLKTSAKNSSEQYQPLIKILAEEIKDSLPWIDQITITRSMPNSLNIQVTEYQPFAIWRDGEQDFLTDKDGNLLPFENTDEFKNMVILSGKYANSNARSLFNIFTIDPQLSQHVYSATWVSNRRWDVRFTNGLLVKLPEKDIASAWKSLIKIYNTPGSIIGLKVIDLRIEGKIYLEYSDSVIKEMHQL